MTGAIIIACMGVSIAGISAWLHVRGRDGSGWGFVAFCLIVTLAQRPEGDMTPWQALLFWPKVLIAGWRVMQGRDYTFRTQPDWFVQAIAQIYMDESKQPNPDPDSREHYVLAEMVRQSRAEVWTREQWRLP